MLQILAYKANAYIYGIAKPYSKEMLRLRGGSILKEIVQRMNYKVSCSSSLSADCHWINSLKYYAYSAHDTTVGPLLYTLGAQDKVLPRGQYPDYASAVAVELWSTESGPSVKVLYRSGPGQDFITITQFVEGCENMDMCSLQQFNQRSEPFMPKNIAEECQAKRVNNTKISCAEMKRGEKSAFGNFIMPHKSH
uniref:Lysosomal acid phosphatase n=1 Tax=Ditylenchus dipsaci TaxID=166011 RepID=A0A915CNH4_9BILA